MTGETVVMYPIVPSITAIDLARRIVGITREVAGWAQ